ncbi:class I SAM-dependent methyltransferase [Nocardia blacklockiae]|uniref:class I SAM-dependent methyltransferase n=1 Tax=Nocardia blacklockiae TaxID=480036 RepID=UPI001894D34A|nr:methyltransferase domain-containing protein [Nocardia blacklockiae]MBF6171762.1 methyltransferase domain-containing protein [Nocardia blacklockiae]
MREVNAVVARALSTLAGQLGNPHGLLGKGVAAMLNRGNRALIAGAVEAAEVGPGAAAADIGFGGGIGLSLLLDRVGADGTVHGVEISPDMLARAKSRYAADVGAGRLRVLEGSLTDLPLADAGVDAAITVNTVYFVTELDRACAELARVLRPGGRLVIGIGDPDAMARMPFTAYGFRLRPVPELIDALERAGFTVEHRPVEHRPLPAHLLIARLT